MYAYIQLDIRHLNRFAKKSRHFYIGSTTCSFCKRHDSRLRKLKQLLQGQLVAAEPSLRFWFHTSSFDQFIGIPLFADLCSRDVRIRELQLISKWQPILNFPFYKAINLKLLGVKICGSQTAHKQDLRPSRLHKHIRNKLSLKWFPLQAIAKNHDSLGCFWSTLHRLSGTTKDAFHVQAFLLRKTVSAFQLLALFRLAKNLDEPWRSKVRGILQRIFKKKGVAVPSNNRPLKLPLLAHPSFVGSVKKWLHSLLVQFPSATLPLHLPSCTVVGISHSSIKSHLHNFQRFMREWAEDPDTMPPCHCHCLSKAFARVTRIDGHVAASASELALPPHVSEMLSFSASSQIYPGREHFVRTSLDLVLKWAKHHKNPCRAEQWLQFVDQEWPLHLRFTSSGAFTWPEIVRIKRLLSKVVVHCQDHQPDHLKIFCPQIFWKGLRSTFLDGDVLSRCTLTPEQALLRLPDIVGSLKDKYPWAFNFDGRLPYGYTLLKEKKQWRTGRSIVAYRSTPLALALKTCAILVDAIVPIAFPEGLDVKHSVKLWTSLHSFMRRIDECCPDDTFQVFNDDLVGFFNNLPQSRIQQACALMIDRYRAKHPLADSVSMSIDLSTQQKEFRVFRGKSFCKQLFVQDIPELVRIAFEGSYFQCMGIVFQQSRGATIGNQLSPALCGLTVAAEEQMWFESFQLFLSSHRHLVFLSRYVDNRFTILPASIAESPAFTKFVDLDFYQPPVQLEEVGDLHFLGFVVSVPDRKISYILPDRKWQIRNPKGASTQATLFSGFKSRLISIIRYTWPIQDVRPAVKQLIRFYVQNGYDQQQLRAI